jgi:hypothetical protein
MAVGRKMVVGRREIKVQRRWIKGPSKRSFLIGENEVFGMDTVLCHERKKLKS